MNQVFYLVEGESMERLLTYPRRHYGSEWAECHLCEESTEKIVTLKKDGIVHKYHLCITCFLSKYFQDKIKNSTVLKVENFNPSNY